MLALLFARLCALCSCCVVSSLPAHTCSSACFTEWYVRHAMHIRLLSLAGEVLTSPATPREGSLRSSWEPCRAAPNHRSPRCHRNVGATEKCRPPRPNPVPSRCQTLMPDPAARQAPLSHHADPAIGPRCPNSDPATFTITPCVSSVYRMCHTRQYACLPVCACCWMSCF